MSICTNCGNWSAYLSKCYDCNIGYCKDCRLPAVDKSMKKKRFPGTNTCDKCFEEFHNEEFEFDKQLGIKICSSCFHSGSH